jgi:hypothetical protein
MGYVFEGISSTGSQLIAINGEEKRLKPFKKCVEGCLLIPRMNPGVNLNWSMMTEQIYVNTRLQSDGYLLRENLNTHTIQGEKMQLRHWKNLLLMLLIISAGLLNGQSRAKPRWIMQVPSGDELSFIYYSGLGESSESLAEAKEQAISNAIQQVLMQGEIAIDMSSQSREQITEHTGKRSTINSQYELTRDILITGKTEIIHGLSIEEDYYETKQRGGRNTYQYWVLMKVPKPGKSAKVISKGYGMRGALRSAILPGWGQFYKGEPKKGWLFMGSEVTLISSALISQQLSVNYADKAARENNLDNRKFYNTMSSRTNTIALVSGVVAAALYGYNLFDAISAPGAKIYANIQTDNLFAAYQIGIEYQINQKRSTK